MYSKHYFVFFDKTNDFTIDEFGNIGRTMEDGPFNSNEIGRHVDTETIFMVRENAEKLVNAWEALDVYYIGDNVIHLHGQPITNGCYFICDNQNRNKSNAPATHNEIKRHLWNVWASVQYLSYAQFNAGTSVSQGGGHWCKTTHYRNDCCGCNRDCWGNDCHGWIGSRCCHWWAGYRHYQQLCIKNNLVNGGANRCYNIWAGDSGDARWWLYEEYYKPREEYRQLYERNYGFMDGNIDNLPYPR